MKFPYYSPNLGFNDILKALFMKESRADIMLKKYFRELTGKKYILITNSCRSALYLAYKSIGRTGEVITSPLTCKVAIDPILESENRVVYADITIPDLTVSPEDILHKLGKETIAIQAIHLGGIPCDMQKIRAIADSNQLWLIEDCAQSLGSLYNTRHTGSFGDISCFSLIKNAYGIGGGILATDLCDVYLAAKSLYMTFNRAQPFLILYRLIRNLAESNRKNPASILLAFLRMLRGKKPHPSTIEGQLNKITSLEKKIAAVQQNKFNELHSSRKQIGNYYLDELARAKLLVNEQFGLSENSFTKLFIYHPSILSKEIIPKLHKSGVEAMHLEQKAGSPFQERLAQLSHFGESGLVNYDLVHDHLLSLPIIENFTKADIREIIHILSDLIKDENSD